MKSYAKTIIAITLLLGPYIFATSPTLPPYHQYSVRGRITRPAGGSVKDLAVLLLAKERFFSANTFQILQGKRVQGERAISLTDSVGVFYIVASSEQKADSLEIGIVSPDRPLVTGNPFSLNGVQSIPQEETFTDTQNGSGCSGCDGPTKVTSVVAYSYYLPDQTVALTW